MSKKDLESMSTEELEAMLAKKKKQEREALEKERKEYEEQTNNLVNLIGKNARDLNRTLTVFKSEMHYFFDLQQEKLNAYGKIRSNSKGGFQLVNAEGNIRVKRVRATEPIWDEKSTKAVELIGEFLRSTVKKADKKLFEILMSFIERNKEGDLEYDRVMQLVQHEDKYDDDRWKEGLRLIKESYKLNFRAYGYIIEQRDEQSGAWERIELNFASIKPLEIDTDNIKLLE